MTDAGTISTEDAAGVVTAWTPANARPAPVEADRELFRPPFSSTWHVDGDDLRGVERLALDFEVWDASDGIPAATIDAEAFLAALAAAAVIYTPLGVFVPRGIESTVRTPTALGYRVDVVLATDGWAADEDGLLRLISGPVWQLR